MSDNIEWESEICKDGNHEWELYTITTGLGISSTDIEQAGICIKCGCKTHSKSSYEENDDRGTFS